MQDLKNMPVELLPEEAFAPLSEEEKRPGNSALPRTTYLQDAWRNFRKNKLALFGLAFLAVMILAAILIPILSPYTYDGQALTCRNAGSSWAHPFGTDKFGRDILVRTMCGARISLTVGFVTALVNLLIGVLYGGLCGYIGGKTDLVLMRIVDIMYSIPTLLYVILIMLIFGSNVFSVLLAISVSGWVGMARQVRSQILSLKEREFAMAARACGAGRARILFRHLIVNAMGPIIVNTTLMVPGAIFTEAFLSFVGIGISQPMASWGTMANEARAVMNLYPMQMVWPVASICLTMLALNFVGDGLRDALNPQRSARKKI